MSYPPADGTPDPYRQAEIPPADPTLQYPPPYSPPTSPAPSSGSGYAPPSPYSSPPSSVPAYAPPPPNVPAYSPPPPPGFGPPQGYPPPDKGQFGGPAYGVPYSPYGVPQTNGLAIASLVCSLAGLVTCISAPVGIVLGHVAKKQIRQTGEQGEGLATAGLWVGYILTGLTLGFVILYILLVVMAIGGTAAINSTI